MPSEWDNLTLISSKALRTTFVPGNKVIDTLERSPLPKTGNIVHLASHCVQGKPTKEDQLSDPDSWMPTLEKLGPVVVVSNDGDHGFPPEYVKYLESEHVKHWFAQNPSVEHPKLTAIPIGLDLHTDTRTPSQQIVELVDIGKVPWSSRKLKAHASFHFVNYDGQQYGYDRRDAVEKLSGPIVWQNGRKPRSQTWKEQSEYKFVISPMGNGLDCHRTWETIALGSVPIVRRVPGLEAHLKPLEGMPVLFVDDWTEVTEELLSKYEYPESWPTERLTLEYWVDLIRKKAHE